MKDSHLQREYGRNSALALPIGLRCAAFQLGRLALADVLSRPLAGS